MQSVLSAESVNFYPPPKVIDFIRTQASKAVSEFHWLRLKKCKMTETSLKPVDQDLIYQCGSAFLNVLQLIHTVTEKRVWKKMSETR